MSRFFKNREVSNVNVPMVSNMASARGHCPLLIKGVRDHVQTRVKTH